MVTFLGAVAMALAIGGVYGVVAFAVSRRTRELGIRMALGATATDIGALVLLSTAAPIVRGLIVGAALTGLGSVALGRVLANAPIPLDARDPGVLAITTLVVIATAFLAMSGPLLRAGRINPADALRESSG